MSNAEKAKAKAKVQVVPITSPMQQAKEKIDYGQLIVGRRNTKRKSFPRITDGFCRSLQPNSLTDSPTLDDNKPASKPPVHDTVREVWDEIRQTGSAEDIAAIEKIEETHGKAVVAKRVFTDEPPRIRADVDLNGGFSQGSADVSTGRFHDIDTTLGALDIGAEEETMRRDLATAQTKQDAENKSGMFARVQSVLAMF